jgi:hypothetical protein
VIQQPSTLWVPDRLGTYGDVVNGFADEIGIPRDAEQRRDIDCLASYGPQGRWLTLETAIIEGRQNGKTKAVLLSIALADLFIFNTEPDRIVWTAHLMKTTLDTFTRVRQLIDGNPMLSSRVRSVRAAKSEESIIMMDGSQMDFMARQAGSGRGLSGKRLIFDEALFLLAATMGSLIPVLSSRDNPQINYGSSAGKKESDHLRSLQRRGRRLNDPSLIMIEYRSPGGWDAPGCQRGIQCSHLVDEVEHCAMDNETNWRMANHAIGAGRMRLEFIRAERRSLCQTPEGVLEFGRERMGWEELGGTTLDPDRIPENLWLAQADPLSGIVGPVVFSVDMPPSASHTSIGVAGRREDGRIHFGLVAYGRGSEWVAERLSGLVRDHETLCPVMWQPSAPVGALRTELRDAGIEMRDVSPQDYAEACGAMKKHIIDGDAFHCGTEILDTAFAASERRVLLEGGWVFGRRKSAGDISPLVTVVLAVLGVDQVGDAQPSVYVV